MHCSGWWSGINGSYRNIELLRDNKVYRIIDIYHFLVNGDQSDNVGLKIMLLGFHYNQRVTVEGQKRPGISENEGETLPIFKFCLWF
jgi:hypothetical protein